jgi:hypothetical protein
MNGPGDLLLEDVSSVEDPPNVTRLTLDDLDVAIVELDDDRTFLTFTCGDYVFALTIGELTSPTADEAGILGNQAVGIAAALPCQPGEPPIG